MISRTERMLAMRFVRILKSELADEPEEARQQERMQITLRQLHGVMARAEDCRAAIHLLADEQSDATPCIKAMVQALEAYLGDTPSACLRQFLFTSPKRADRALAELNRRIEIIEFILVQLGYKK